MKKALSILMTALLLCASLTSCEKTVDDEKSESVNSGSDIVSSENSDPVESSEPEESSEAPASQIVTDEDSGESYDLSEYSPIGTEGATKIIIRYSDVGKIMNVSFANNTDITDVYIEDGIEYFNFYDFEWCTSLKSVRLPRTLKSFDGSEQKKGGGTFFGCISLESIYIPDGVEGIDDEVFAGCTSLKSIRIPDSVTYFGINAFFGCPAIEDFTFPPNLTGIARSGVPAGMKEWDLSRSDNIRSVFHVDAAKVIVTEGSQTHETFARMAEFEYFDIVFKDKD